MVNIRKIHSDEMGWANGAVKELAVELLAYDDAQLARAIASGPVIEVTCHGQG